VNNVNFSLSVGTAVPRSVRVVDVPPELIEINPQWRGYQYFVVRDEIVIVDRGRNIVAAVPVGSSGGAQLHNKGGASGALDLTPEQIRQAQIVLKERGFDVEVDGRLGPRTTQALIAFQRQQGFQASGRLDSGTVTALGLSNMTGAQGGATTGQGAQPNQGANQPSTSGQGGATQQTPAQKNQGASQNQGPGQSSTTGKGGDKMQQPPANQNPSRQGQQDSGSK
jgi:peptidoglycan hydrolase-like protein with peptidoglycan-binding domain